MSVGQHGKVIDDGRVKKPDIVLPPADVGIRTRAAASGTLRFGVKEVVLSKALACRKAFIRSK